jgi:hypothetical protein
MHGMLTYGECGLWEMGVVADPFFDPFVSLFRVLVTSPMAGHALNFQPTVTH